MVPALDSESLQCSVGWVLEELDCHQEREGRRRPPFAVVQAAGGGDDCAVDCIH